MDIIIGAGVTGLSYAYFTDNDYLIIEKESEIGGYCRTIKQDGFVWDYAGHFFHFRSDDLREMVTRHIDPSTLRKVEKHTQIIYKDRYIDFPFQKNIHQLPKQEFIDSLYDLFTVDSIKETKSFKDMVYANLGASIADKFLIPYNEKLYACDLDTLDKDAMGRFFPKANKEDIIKNFKKPETGSYNDHFVYPKGGAIEYINSIYKQIDPKKISLNEKIISIDKANKIVKTDKREFKYDNLINTSPFNDLLDMVSVDYDKKVFTWNKVLVFNLGFDKKGKDSKNSWLYIPDKDITFYRIGYYDNIIGDDRMSLYVEIGFNNEVKDIDTEYYLDKTLKDLKKVGILSDEQNLISHNTLLMDPAYVHVNKISDKAVLDFKEGLANDSIYSAGRYGSWTYCSIEDNILEARQLAKEIAIK